MLPFVARKSRSCRKKEQVAELQDYCESKKVRADVVNEYLESVCSAPLSDSRKLAELVARPELSLADLMKIVPHGTFSPEVVESVEIGLKYAGYIEREKPETEALPSRHHRPSLPHLRHLPRRCLRPPGLLRPLILFHVELYLPQRVFVPKPSPLRSDPSQSRLTPSSGPSLLYGRGWP